jgi:hypothetical protein
VVRCQILAAVPHFSPSAKKQIRNRALLAKTGREQKIGEPSAFVGTNVNVDPIRERTLELVPGGETGI